MPILQISIKPYTCKLILFICMSVSPMSIIDLIVIIWCLNVEWFQAVSIQPRQVQLPNGVQQAFSCFQLRWYGILEILRPVTVKITTLNDVSPPGRMNNYQRKLLWILMIYHSDLQPGVRENILGVFKTERKSCSFINLCMILLFNTLERMKLI
jgi:hypothetical protein